MKKMPFSMHVDVDKLLPATDAEKEYLVQMRPSTTFFRDGVKRLLRNKVATVSFFVVVIIALVSIFLPMFWPYSYDAMLGNVPGAPMDSSYTILRRLSTERPSRRESKQERVFFLMFSGPTLREETIL